MKKTLLYILALLFASSCTSNKHEAEAFRFLRQGYDWEAKEKDEQAMLCYKQAEEAIRTVNNRKLHFLVYTALGKLNTEYAHYPIAMNYFRKAIDLKLSGSTWNTMLKEFHQSSVWWRGKPNYEQIKLHAEGLQALIERMDFASQESVNLRQALLYKDASEWEKADSILQEALSYTSVPKHRCRLYAELAHARQQANRLSEADSLYAEALKSSSRSLKASIYKNIYQQQQSIGETNKAFEALQKYTLELEQLYNSESRTKMLEIERKYDLHALKREYDNYRHQGTITLLSALAIVCALGILSWGIWKYLQKQKEEQLYTYKKEAYALQTRIDNLQEQMEESEDESKGLQEQIKALEKEKEEKNLRIHQLEVTFRAKRITLSSDTAEAVQLYLHLMSRQGAKYQPAEDRFKLAHWLNVSQNLWADRLATQYPTLSNGEKDICYLFAIGFSFDEMADLLQIQPRSVDRSVYRICKKMGFEQGNKEEFAKQLKFLNTQP